MPWWGWIILTLVCLAVLVAAVAYAIIHAVRAFKSLGPTQEAFTLIVDRMSEEVDESSPEHRPIFTRTLVYAKDQYCETQTVLADRKTLRRRRHSRTWQRWNER